jgi:hypothetical protein
LIALYESYRDQPSGFAMEDYADWSADAHALLRADAELMQAAARDLVILQDRLDEKDETIRRVQRIVSSWRNQYASAAASDLSAWTLIQACDTLDTALAAHPAASAQTGETK